MFVGIYFHNIIYVISFAFSHVNDTVCMELSSTRKEILQQKCREIYNNSKVNHATKFDISSFVG